MAQKMLESSALSSFCGGMAAMLSAGIQIDEATHMLAENREASQFRDVCQALYDSVSKGNSLATAMKETGAFPQYAIDMMTTGEHSGHMEQVLRNLEMYYDEEDRLFTKLRSNVGYPAALLTIMSIILGFTVAVILPVFYNVYANMSGSLASGSFASVQASVIIGWVALIVMTACAIGAIALAASANSATGRDRVIRLLEKLPQTKRAMHQLALSRFTAALATLASSGITDEEAMSKALATVEHPLLHQQIEKAVNSMTDIENPRSLVQAIEEFQVFEPLYTRMLNVGIRSGNTDETLANLSTTFFDDAIVQIDRMLDGIEPVLAAFLTIAVGTSLIAVMLPLIGIMSSIG